MAITVNKHGHATTDSTVATLNTTWTGGGSSSAGDVLVIIVSWNGTSGSNLASVSDSNGSNVWTIQETLDFGGSGIFGAIATSPNTATVTTITPHFSPSVNFIRSFVVSVSGADTVAPINASDAHFQDAPGTTSNVITSQSGTTATTVDGCLVVGGSINITSVTLPDVGSSPITFSSVDSLTNGGDSDCQRIESGTQTTHGTVAANFSTIVGTDQFGNFMVAIAPVVSAPSSTVIPHTPPPIYIFS
jgi:hypothetical protein